MMTLGSTFSAQARAQFPPSVAPMFIRGPLRAERPKVPEWARPAGELGKTLTLRAHVDALTGYGQLAGGLVRELSKLGQPIQCLPMVAPWEPVGWGKAAILAEDVRSRLVKANEEGWELLMASPHHVEEVSPSIHLTMWESNRLPEGVAAKLNAKQALIVPSEWALLAFDAAGVTRPMYKANLPISTVFRQYRPMPEEGPFTFGMCCRRAHGGLRKGVVQACEAFLAAFPSQKDVRFRLKFYPDCDVKDVPQDPRIEVIKAAYTEAQVADFLASLHCYVSTSQAEGYGLVQCQAMGLGRPVIGARAHAQAEYLTEENAWLADYELKDSLEVNPDNGYYQGFSFPLKTESVVDRMRAAYQRPDVTQAKGVFAHNRAVEMTWDKFTAEVLAALRAEGMPV